MGAPGTARIYYSTNNFPTHYIDAPISRWDCDNESIIVETFLSSSNRDTLFAHVTPQAVRELYDILGEKKFIDTTYSSGNSLVVEPQGEYGISSLREKTDIAVKNITDWFIPHTKYFGVKIEGVVL